MSFAIHSLSSGVLTPCDVSWPPSKAVPSNRQTAAPACPARMAAATPPRLPPTISMSNCKSAMDFPPETTTPCGPPDRVPEGGTIERLVPGQVLETQQVQVRACATDLVPMADVN